MKFASATIATVFATVALAAPTPAAEAKSAVADVPQWTVEGLKRVCDDADTSCTWTFSVDTHLADPTPCSFTVKGSPASQTDSANNVCGPYTIGSGWSDQFGPENGFTTLSVVDVAQKLIIWPSYSDATLAGGAVAADLSYPPTSIA
ncbi:small secreted protein [Hypoxylon trugodes]|uniref:small secreted protein n=1 Tax=Hypoxylon trugodes TaxID=326681 RepID=UPI00218D9709|nr:small secreted protein [Hypoxylon trugodes]KAI1387856.1 small secreted protein [Hypoxylon trugodes]